MAKKSVFYKIYIISICVFAVLLAVGLFLLYSFLKSYEASQRVNTVKSIVRESLEKGDIYTLKDKFAIKISDYETKENANAAFKEFIKGSKSFDIVKTAKLLDGASNAFVIKSGNKKILTVYLKKGEKSGKFGLDTYKVLSAELASELYKTVTVKTYSTVKLSVNGKEVNETDAKDDKLPKLPKNVLPDNAITKQTLKLENLLNEKITLTAKENGKDLETEQSENLFVVKEALDETGKKYEQFAIEATETYAAYMQNDKSFATLSKYLLPATDFYKNLKTSAVSFAWKHNGYEFKNVKSSENHKYSDNLYSFRISLTQVLKLGNREYVDNVDKNVFVLNQNGTLKIVDMQSLEG